MVGLVLATLLVTSGCSYGGDPEASPASTESSGSSEPSSSASPTEAVKEEPAPVDPCSLLTADELTAAGLEPDVEKSARGLVSDPRVTACQVPSPKNDGGWEVFYGYSTKPFLDVFDAVEQVGTEKPQNLTAGDGGQLVMYKAYGDKYWYAFAASGKYTVMAEFFSQPTKGQGRPAARGHAGARRAGHVQVPRRPAVGLPVGEDQGDHRRARHGHERDRLAAVRRRAVQLRQRPRPHAQRERHPDEGRRRGPQVGGRGG